MPRREQIEAMLKDDPRDQFLRYSLAMETAKEGDHDRSQEVFRELRADEPPYVPAFFMAAQKLAEIGRSEEAKALLTAGIAEAQAQGNAHAAGEMQEFLQAIS